MSRAFDRPHRGHVSRSDELFSAALRRGCRGRNRALLPFCTVIETSTFRGRVARRGRSCFRCVPVYAPKTGRRYDQRRLAQFRYECSVYTGRRPVPVPICGACGTRPSSCQNARVSRCLTNPATPSWRACDLGFGESRSSEPSSFARSAPAFGRNVCTRPPKTSASHR
jgi:hypothetical protein